jgi:hypothetical protein
MRILADDAWSQKHLGKGEGTRLENSAAKMGE